MKVRTNFVSNSSSSSFVVACQEMYLDDVIKDLSRACYAKSKGHNKSLKKRNNRILDFCLHTFQLAFVGKLLLKTTKQKYSLSTFKKMWAISASSEGNDFYKKEWERYKACLKKIRLGKNVDSWVKKDYDLDEYDPKTDTAVHYEKTYVKDVVVSNDVMEYELKRYHFSGASSSTENDIKERVKSLLKLAETKHNVGCRLTSNIDIYKITKDTIANTRDLISQGYVIELEEWQDLNALEAKLDSGNAIFYVRIADSGDGYGDFYIYREDDADGLGGISGIEVLNCESL